MHLGRIAPYHLRTIFGEKLKLTALVKVGPLGDLGFKLQAFLNMNYSSYQIYRIFGDTLFF